MTAVQSALSDSLAEEGGAAPPFGKLLTDVICLVSALFWRVEVNPMGLQVGEKRVVNLIGNRDSGGAEGDGACKRGGGDGADRAKSGADGPVGLFSVR